jgi:hypothetical protein
MDIPDKYDDNVHRDHYGDNNENEIVYLLLKIGETRLGNIRQLCKLFTNIISPAQTFGKLGSTRPKTEPSPVNITTPMQFPTTQCDPAIPMHDVSKKLSSVESTVPRTGRASPNYSISTHSTQAKLLHPVTCQDGPVELHVRRGLHESHVGR